MDFKNLEKMISEKYISVQKHPDEDLYIYNYTQKAQFDRVWNNETLNCRGLILDAKKNVIARPFSKFFNLDEAIDQGEQLPLEDFIVQEKFDGSLGILYWIDNIPYLATRGSFLSDQAIEGTKILRGYGQYLSELNRGYTYLFEIIYPENRIVVDYGTRRDLVLLAVIDTKTGEEKSVYEECSKFPFAGHVDGVKDYKTLASRAEVNKEGFVIMFPKSGKRYKVKFDEYVRLHRLITGVNKRRIWDILRSGGDLNELLERVPDEFFNWVKKTVSELEQEFESIRSEAGKVYVDLIENTTSRKEFALAAQKHPKVRAFLFMMRDNKAEEVIAKAIWRTLRPKHETPFKIEI